MARRIGRVTRREEAALEDAACKALVHPAEGVNVRGFRQRFDKGSPLRVDDSEGEVGVDRGDQMEHLSAQHAPRVGREALACLARASTAAQPGLHPPPLGALRVGRLERPARAPQPQKELEDGFVRLECRLG